MQFDSSQQVSSTYARNHFSEVMDKARNEKMQIVTHRSAIPVIVIRMDDFEKATTPPVKPKKYKKFDLEEIRKNSTFRKYRGCMENDPDFKGLTAKQALRKWTDYVD